MAYRRNRCHVLWEYYPWLCRVWGILTAISFWGVGAEAAYWHDTMFIYLLLVAALLTFLETVFAFSICVVLCVGDEHERFLRCWKHLLWLDDYRKGLFYMVLSVPCYIRFQRLWISVISGVMLSLCGIYYCIKTYKTRLDAKLRQLQERRAFDDVSIEDANDLMTQPDPSLGMHMAIPQDSDSSSGGIADQDEILEV